MTTLVLASTSRFRAAVLTRLGVPFTAQAPDFEERDPGGLDPVALAQTFARGKAQSVAADPGALVIGADQVLEFEGRVLRKPDGLEGAAAQLHELAGRSHTLHSALAVWDGTRLEESVTSVQLTVRPLTLEQARAYVALDQPLGSVGGYTYEQRGIGLFTRMSGGDDSAILGLPLIELVHVLEKLGWDLFTAWGGPAA